MGHCSLCGSRALAAAIAALSLLVPSGASSKNNFSENQQWRPGMFEMLPTGELLVFGGHVVFGTTIDRYFEPIVHFAGLSDRLPYVRIRYTIFPAGPFRTQECDVRIERTDFKTYDPLYGIARIHTERWRNARIGEHYHEKWAADLSDGNAVSFRSVMARDESDVLILAYSAFVATDRDGRNDYSIRVDRTCVAAASNASYEELANRGSMTGIRDLRDLNPAAR